MFSQFRVRYPKGCLVTELSAIDHGKYVVRCLVQDEGTTLATGLAAAETVELAEDRARSRALAVLDLSPTTLVEEQESPPTHSEVLIPPTPTPTPSTVFSDALGGRSLDATATQSLAAEAPHSAIARSDDETTTTVLESREPTKATRRSKTSKARDDSDLSSFESKREKASDYAEPTPVVDQELTFANDFSATEIETPPSVETPLWMAEDTAQTELNHDAPTPPYSQDELESDTSEPPASSTPIDFSEIIARTNVELKRLGWTNQQGRDYLIQTYGKRSRQLLSDDELLDFLHHLEAEPAPE